MKALRAPTTNGGRRPLAFLMEQASQTPFTTRDGHNLAVFDWPLGGHQTPRAVVLIVHGLGEHAWRHNPLACMLNEWGFAVRAYDQRGHGDSTGKPGSLPNRHTLQEDLADVLASTRAIHRHLPVVLMGHGMGGLVAALHTLDTTADDPQQMPVDALVLSSPTLQLGLGALQRALLAMLPPVFPDVTLSSGLDPRLLSRDHSVVQDYQQDPRVHNRMSPRLVRFMARGGERVRAAAPTWRVPTLLVYAGTDGLVDPKGSHRFASTAPPQVVTALHFAEAGHELFNELNRFEVLNDLRGWLDQRF